MLTTIFLLYTFGLIASAVCVMVIMRQKPSEEQKIMSGLTTFIFITWLGYWLGVKSNHIPELILSNKVMYTGCTHIYLLMLLFIFRYVGIKPPKWLTSLLCFADCTVNAFALTMDTHENFYKNISFIEYDGMNIITFESGIFHLVYVALNAVYCVLMFIIAGIGVKRDRERFANLGGLVFAALIPMAMNTLFAAGYTDFDFTPVGYLISEIIIFFLIYGSKIYDVKDTAREFIFDTLDDAIVVMDKQYRLKGYNELAKSLFADLSYAKPDMAIDVACPDVNQILYEKGHSDINHGERVYRPSIRKMIDKEDGNKLKGYVVWLTDVTEEIRNMELLGHYQRDLERDVERKTKQIEYMQEQMIYSFASLVESRDNITGEHVRRTSAYVTILAKELRRRGRFVATLTDSYLDHLRLAAPLHDIGKITVPDSVLKKPGKLEPEEFVIMQNHTVEGGKILEGTLKSMEGESFFNVAKEVAVYHHEKWNGKGYPYGLSGEDIPVSARIMAVADFFDALTSSRPYKKAYSVDKAYSILLEESGKQFDPQVVDAFVAIRPEVEKVIIRFNGALPVSDNALSERDVAIAAEKMRNGRNL